MVCKISKIMFMANFFNNNIKKGMTETSMCHSVTTLFDEQTSYKHAYESCGKLLK